ncbi:MAG: hypothetical protein AB1505_23880 [Candidatus Latescibacterota bacterium]
MPENGPRDSSQGRRARLAEDLFIILCILSLWPVILGWRHPVYQFILYLALAGLVVIFFRRLKRFRDVRDDAGR